jgi:cation-transporting ATPase F
MPTDTLVYFASRETKDCKHHHCQANIMDIPNDTNWHHHSAKDLVEQFSSQPDRGLETDESARRLQVFGPNVVTMRRGRGPLVRFLLQFHQPLVYLLLVAGAVTAAFQEWVDSAVIFGVVLVNAVVGFIQESKAVKAMQALARALTTEATVIREGKKSRIPSPDIVLGDIILLRSGDKVPADLRLLRCRDLQIAEAALTGESVPAPKSLDPLAAETVLGDRTNMAYAGTLVTYGQGTGLVVATGDRTEVGRISHFLATAEELQTPLTRRIAQFSSV